MSRSVVSFDLRFSCVHSPLEVQEEKLSLF